MRQSPGRSRRPYLDHAAVVRAADLPVEGSTRPRLRRAGRVRLHQPGVGSAADLPAGRANWRPRSPSPTPGMGLPGPGVNGAGPRGGTVAAPLGTWRQTGLGRWGSCPYATGRRLVGLIPRWGRGEIRLGPAWVRYRGTASPETDPPSTFHRPVLVPGRHRARSSRLRVTLPRCQPSF